jgi:hypothetical protein
MEKSGKDILIFNAQGLVNEVICSLCKKREQIPGQFPINYITSGKRVVYKTRNAFLKALADQHYERHILLKPSLPPVIRDVYRIVIDTYKQGEKVYILEQNLYCNDTPEMEVFIEWEEENRLLACIVNLGLACRWFEESSIRPGVVEIQSDQDGKDQKYGGEQDTLFHLLFPESGWIAKKNAGLYSEYDQYLKRIRQLQYKQLLTIKLKTSTVNMAL